MRRLAPRPVGAALERLTGRIAPASTLARVQACWPDVAGAAVAREAEPVAERGGVLTVSCRSAAWAQELDLLSADLVERLNDAVAGENSPSPLRALRFVVGARPVPA